MRIRISEEDIAIWKGVEELRAAAQADIEEAHGGAPNRFQISAKTLELYPKIIDGIEEDRDINSN